MPLTLSSLIAPVTRDEVRKTVLSLLRVAGFPVASWHSSSVPRALVEVFCEALADLSSTVGKIARGGFLSLADGEWLTLLAAEFFDLTRKPAVFARGVAVLTDGGGGPFTILPGQLWATSKSGKRFNNSRGGTLVAGGKLALEWQAESPGASFNVPAGDLTTLLTPLPGVALDNPTLPSIGTWLTRQGVDEETDAQLVQRCKEQWSSLGAGGNAPAYAYHAKRASDQVTRVRVYEATPKGGHVTVVIAGPGGAIVDPTVAVKVFDYLEDGRRPQCVKTHVVSATNRAIAILGEARVAASLRDVAAAHVSRSLTELQTSLDIGTRVPVAELIQRVMDAPGVTNVALRRSSGALLVPQIDDFVLAATEVATFTNSLAFLPT